MTTIFQNPGLSSTATTALGTPMSGPAFLQQSSQGAALDTFTLRLSNKQRSTLLTPKPYFHSAERFRGTSLTETPIIKEPVDVELTNKAGDLLEIFQDGAFFLFRNDMYVEGKSRPLDFRSFDPGLEWYNPELWFLITEERDISLPAIGRKIKVEVPRRLVGRQNIELYPYREYKVDYEGGTVLLQVAELNGKEDGETVERIHNVLSSMPGALIENGHTLTIFPKGISFPDPCAQASFWQDRIYMLHPETIRDNFKPESVERDIKEALLHEFAHGFSNINLTPWLFVIREYTRYAIEKDGTHGYDEHAKTSLGEALSVGFQSFGSAQRYMQQLILNLMLNPEWDPDEINKNAFRA